MSNGQAKKPGKPKPMPIYLTVRKLMDPVTGQIVGAFVPNCDTDQHYLRERGYKVGEKVRAVLTKPRNEKFNRLVHGLGHLIVENIEGFEGLRAHDAIKKLQSIAKIHCHIETLTIEDVVVQRFIPQSLSFDSMDEYTFQDFWSQCCKYLIDKHWLNLTEEELTEMVEFQRFSSM